jgi:hypothetical protein
MNEEDTFCSEDKVIQFINIGSSNAESPTKSQNPLLPIQIKPNHSQIRQKRTVHHYTQMPHHNIDD